MSPSPNRPSIAAAVALAVAASVRGPTLAAAAQSEAATSQTNLRRRLEGNTCAKMCVIGEVAASCKDHIQRSSLVDFLGDPKSCDEAQALVADRCEVCADCPAHEAYCDVLELPPTIPPTTTIPPGGACEAVCNVGGQAAKCKDRILWSSINTFPNKPDACASAHKLVLGQCDVCKKCELPKVGCVDADTKAAEAAEREAEKIAAKDEEFDCTQGYKTWKEDWSKAKQHWCCEKEGRGCGKMADIEIVRQKFDLDAFRPHFIGGDALPRGASAVQARSTALGLLLIVGGAVGFMVAAGLFGQSRRQAPADSSAPQALLEREARE